MALGSQAAHLQPCTCYLWQVWSQIHHLSCGAPIPVLFHLVLNMTPRGCMPEPMQTAPHCHFSGVHATPARASELVMVSVGIC